MFNVMGIRSLVSEKKHKIPIQGFVKDFLKMCDEVTKPKDIEDLWHIDAYITLQIMCIMFLKKLF